MRQNTKRFYTRIQNDFNALTEQGMNPTDAKHHLGGLWFKNTSSIGRILKQKIEVTPSVQNPK